MIILITGGIGSGKSVVSRVLRCMGYEVYDCDSRAKALMDGSPEIHRRLRHEISPLTVNPDCTINRSELSRIVFADPTKLAALNAIVHGAVREDIRREAEGVRLKAKGLRQMAQGVRNKAVASELLHLTPHALNLTPHALRLITPYALRLTPYTLRLTPYTLHLTPYALRLTPKQPILFVETAIPVSGGMVDMADTVWEVTAPEQLRIRRVQQRSGLSPDQIRARIAAQHSEQVSGARVIVNDNRQALLPQILKQLSRLH